MKVLNRTRRTTDLDGQIGACLRAVRLSRGLTQEKIAERVGVTCQQWHKYEKGINRISAAGLLKALAAVDCPPAEFFDGLDMPTDNGVSHTDQEMVHLVGDYRQIEDQHHRSAVRALVRALAQAEAA